MVPEGETMLVLGRPGAGCSTLRERIRAVVPPSAPDSLHSRFLAVRAIANQRAPFVRIDGEVHYSSITAKEAKKYFDGASTALVRQRCSSRLTGCSY